MKPHCRNFRADAAAACADGDLRRVLDHATRYFQTKRRVALEAFDGRDAHFARARHARLNALARLPQLLEELERNATAAGVRVHWAVDAAEAREIVAGIARDCGAKIVVKGKSMISEEIGLNPALEEAGQQWGGLEVWETDLGEFIVQLAGEPPSHIIAPAIHKSREQVAELFRDRLGLPLTGEESIPELTLIARRALREKFLAADLGVTGVNVAVAATGSVILMENEGNIRMSTTCPPVHVAVMSVEKVVADMDAAADVLRALPRSATGQRMSSYVSVLTGPRKGGDADGAREMHLVILDNGRSRVLADPALAEILLCFRCGACVNACPVYQTIGGHAYGWVYSGPIGAVLASALLPVQDAPDTPFGCTQCGACRRACPLGIDHPRMLLHLRRRVAQGRGNPLAALHGFLARHPLAYRAAMTVARAVDPRLELLPRALRPLGLQGLARFAATRRLPALNTPFSARFRARLRSRHREDA